MWGGTFLTLLTMAHPACELPWADCQVISLFQMSQLTQKIVVLLCADSKFSETLNRKHGYGHHFEICGPDKHQHLFTYAHILNQLTEMKLGY